MLTTADMGELEVEITLILQKKNYKKQDNFVVFTLEIKGHLLLIFTK